MNEATRYEADERCPPLVSIGVGLQGVVFALALLILIVAITAKEALIRALGTGHSLDVSQFQLPPNMRNGEATGLFRFPHLPSFTWRLENLSNEHFAAALAYELEPSAPFMPDLGPVS